MWDPPAPPVHADPANHSEICVRMQSVAENDAVVADSVTNHINLAVLRRYATKDFLYCLLSNVPCVQIRKTVSRLALLTPVFSPSLRSQIV